MMVARLKIEFSKQGYESCVLTRGTSQIWRETDDLNAAWMDLESFLCPSTSP